jgi:surface antigen
MLDEKDQARQVQVIQTVLESAPSGRSSAWVNPDNGYAGSVPPCRRPDGSWKNRHLRCVLWFAAIHAGIR